MAASDQEKNGGFDLSSYLDAVTRRVEGALDRLLPGVNEFPSALHESMRYSIFAGGKRMRPAICLAAADAVGGSSGSTETLAAAVECIHTYSLIHDDLPCMDDDDFRRGKPTNHKRFGEGIAVLAGDALLTVAFEIALKAESAGAYSPLDYVRELTTASGSLNLIAGQVADLEAEGSVRTVEELRAIHERKTSALLTAAARLGAMSAGASEKSLALITTFGQKVGLAFQVIDDILDVTQSTEELGKTAGKDIRAMKATYPSLLGLDASRDYAAELTRDAFDAIAALETDASALSALATYLLKRKN